MATSSTYTPSQEFIDKGIRDAWFTFLSTEFLRLKQQNPTKGEIEKFANTYSDDELFAIFEKSKPYKALPPRCQTQAKVMAILRNASWP